MDDLAARVSQTSSVLGSGLTGPFSSFAQGALVSSFNLADGLSSTDIAASVHRFLDQNTPAVFDKLKKAEALFIKSISTKALEMVNDAKQQTGSGLPSNLITHCLAVIVLLGFFGVVGWVVSGGLSAHTDSIGIIGSAIGYVSAKADQIVSYYFGSSKDHTDSLQSGQGASING